MSIIKIIQRFLQLFGVRLHRLPTPKQIAEAQILAEAAQQKTVWLRNIGVKTILDIGANTGQFAKDMHQIFPDAMLYSFEPLTDCYEKLVANFEGVPQFQAFNLALGNETGQIEIHRSEFSPSSSLLPMAELHKKCFPFTSRESIQKVSIVRLDDIASSLNLQKPMLIKLDVQGFEDKVIAGGMSVVTQAEIVIIELSTEQLYEGQPLFDCVYQILVKLGFQYRGNYNQLYHPDDGRVLQVDGIFIKR